MKSKRKGGKKDSEVSGEVQLQFTLVDSANPDSSLEEISYKFRSLMQAEEEAEEETDANQPFAQDSNDEDDSDDETESVATVDGSKDKKSKKKKKKLARLRRQATVARAYEFVGRDSDISGMIFMEIGKVTDLPPEKNSKFGVLSRRKQADECQ